MGTVPHFNSLEPIKFAFIGSYEFLKATQTQITYFELKYQVFISIFGSERTVMGSQTQAIFIMGLSGKFRNVRPQIDIIQIMGFFTI